MKYAPIALFVYERLWHTQQTVASLQKAHLAAQSELYIYCDAAKENVSNTNITAVRKWVKQISGFKKVHIIQREDNYGLAKSIIEGVTELVNCFQKVIVVEDDLLVSPYFLKYMNDGLNLYEQDFNVASIHGYAFPIKEPMPETYFMKGTDCWGWGTWKRAWDKFEPDGNKLLGLLQQKNLIKEFDYNHTQPYTQMLKDQILGKNNSWAIRWHASAFVHNMLTLFPGKSLVRNIGMDNSGQHCVATHILDVELNQEPITLKRISVEKNEEASEAFVRYFKSMRESFFKKFLRKFKRLLAKNKGNYA